MNEWKIDVGSWARGKVLTIHGDYVLNQIFAMADEFISNQPEGTFESGCTPDVMKVKKNGETVWTPWG